MLLAIIVMLTLAAVVTLIGSSQNANNHRKDVVPDDYTWKMIRTPHADPQEHIATIPRAWRQ